MTARAQTSKRAFAQVQQYCKPSKKCATGYMTTVLRAVSKWHVKYSKHLRDTWFLVSQVQPKVEGFNMRFESGKMAPCLQARPSPALLALINFRIGFAGLGLRLTYEFLQSHQGILNSKLGSTVTCRQWRRSNITCLIAVFTQQGTACTGVLHLF